MITQSTAATPSQLVWIDVFNKMETYMFCKKTHQKHLHMQILNNTQEQIYKHPIKNCMLGSVYNTLWLVYSTDVHIVQLISKFQQFTQWIWERPLTWSVPCSWHFYKQVAVNIIKIGVNYQLYLHTSSQWHIQQVQPIYTQALISILDYQTSVWTYFNIVIHMWWH